MLPYKIAWPVHHTIRSQLMQPKHCHLYLHTVAVVEPSSVSWFTGFQYLECIVLGLLILWKFEDGVNPCPGIWVFLQWCQHLLSHTLLKGRQCWTTLQGWGAQTSDLANTVEISGRKSHQLHFNQLQWLHLGKVLQTSILIPIWGTVLIMCIWETTGL